MYQVSLTQKRICSYTHYTHRAYFNIQDKSILLIALPAKNITEKIFNQKRIQKEKYEMKGEIKK